MVVQILKVSDTEKERDTRYQDTLEAAHIGQDIQNRVANSFYNNQVPVHLYLHALD